MNYVVYRTCDRPKYTQQTFPHLIEMTSPDVGIVMVENSGLVANKFQNQKTYTEHADDRCILISFDRRLGITQPLIEGINYGLEIFGPPEHVFSCDDDRLVPPGWDLALSEMLDAGRYVVVGISRTLREGPVNGGVPWRFMSAANAGFLYSLHVEHPIKVTPRDITAFNVWTTTYAKDRIAWHPTLTAQEIDKYHPEGLHHTEYKDYSAYVQEMRDNRSRVRR